MKRQRIKVCFVFSFSPFSFRQLKFCIIEYHYKSNFLTGSLQLKSRKIIKKFNSLKDAQDYQKDLINNACNSK